MTDLTSRREAVEAVRAWIDRSDEDLLDVIRALPAFKPDLEAAREAAESYLGKAIDEWDLCELATVILKAAGVDCE